MSAASLSLTCSCAYCASAANPTTLLLLAGDQGGVTVLLTPGERATCQLMAADRRALVAFLADGDAPQTSESAPHRRPAETAARDD